MTNQGVSDLRDVYWLCDLHKGMWFVYASVTSAVKMGKIPPFSPHKGVRRSKSKELV